MQNFYTIIYALIRPEIDEKISLGLLAISNNGELFLNISKTKLSIVKNLLNKELYTGIKDEISYIQNLYNQTKTAPQTLFNQTNAQHQVIEKTHINYLSKYKNNIVIFSKTKQLELPINQSIFQKLYALYIDSEPFALSNTPSNKSIEVFKKEFVPTLRPYYNTHFSIDTTIIPNAIIPLKFDLAGKNKKPVFVKAIDLERRMYNVEHDINTFYSIQNLSPNSKRFLVSKEPEKQYKKQHAVWNHLRHVEWLEYIDVSEMERLKIYAKEHMVEPLVQENKKDTPLLY